MNMNWFRVHCLSFLFNKILCQYFIKMGIFNNVSTALDVNNFWRL